MLGFIVCTLRNIISFILKILLVYPHFWIRPIILLSWVLIRWTLHRHLNMVLRRFLWLMRMISDNPYFDHNKPSFVLLWLQNKIQMLHDAEVGHSLKILFKGLSLWYSLYRTVAVVSLQFHQWRNTAHQKAGSGGPPPEIKKKRSCCSLGLLYNIYEITHRIKLFSAQCYFWNTET